MDLLALIGFIVLIYYLIYMIVPWFLDCDIRLAYKEKFGKPISSLKGKVIWITGASSGIGEHLAYVLAGNGCKLILSARRKNELDRVKQRCLEENEYLQDTDIEVIAFDMCDINIHEGIFNSVIEKFGRLDILVNNAGRSQRAQWQNIELPVDKQMFDLNVFSVLSLSRLAVKHFLQTGSGHIVVTSSLAGILPVPFSASYTGSKHSLHGYFYSLLVENMDKDLAVTVVCPGPIKTDFLPECFTGTAGEKFGQKAEPARNKIKPERCATLMAIAIANKLTEVWISLPTGLQLTYFLRYYPNLAPWIVRTLGLQFFQRLRDNKVTQETSSS